MMNCDGTYGHRLNHSAIVPMLTSQTPRCTMEEGAVVASQRNCKDGHFSIARYHSSSAQQPRHTCNEN